MLYILIQKLSHMKYIVIIVSFLKTNRYVMLPVVPGKQRR